MSRRTYSEQIVLVVGILIPEQQPPIGGLQMLSLFVTAFIGISTKGAENKAEFTFGGVVCQIFFILWDAVAFFVFLQIGDDSLCLKICQ
tara:strand:- start:2625 stop:2891 length:267 start_codon:yes stop_codon:yes gene_type:complete